MEEDLLNESPQQLGKFTLLHLLAQGGMAEVYLAEGPNSRRDPLVCVKVILPALAGDRQFLELFIQEAKVTAQLSHKNLLRVDDFGMEDGRLYLAIEYIRGRSLADVVKGLRTEGKSLPPSQAAAALQQAAVGLHQAHDARDAAGKPLGIVHRDISPDNLMLRDDGVVKVVDFGIAKATAAASAANTTTLKGKPLYMAPEQILAQAVDRRTDVFALGVTLYELCTGARMFHAKTDAVAMQQILSGPLPDPRSLNPEIPDGLATVIRTACARPPELRYQTAADLAEDLEPFAGVRAREALAAFAARTFADLPRTRADALAAGSATDSGPRTGAATQAGRKKRKPAPRPEDALPAFEGSGVREATAQTRNLGGRRHSRPAPKLTAEGLPDLSEPSAEAPTSVTSLTATARAPRTFLVAGAIAAAVVALALAAALLGK